MRAVFIMTCSHHDGRGACHGGKTFRAGAKPTRVFESAGFMFTDPPLMVERIARRIESTRVADAMCRLSLDAPCARSLGQLTEHPALIRELRGVGAPETILAPAGAESSADLVRRRLPWLRKIRNTSASWRLRRILNDLYDYTTPEILEADIESLDARVAAASVDPQWPGQVLADRCRVDRITCDLAQVSQGLNPATAEDAMGVRVNYFWNATGLLSFEHHAKAADRHVTRPAYSQSLRAILNTLPGSLAQLNQGVGDFLDATVTGQVKFITARLATRIRLEHADAGAIDHLLSQEAGGVPLTEDETELLASATGAAIFAWANQNGRAIVLQGLGRSPHQPYSCPAALARLARHFGSARFVLSDYAADFAPHAHKLAASLPNVAVAGHSESTFVSSLIADETLQRLQIVPIGKCVGFASHAPTVEWVYANYQAVRYGIARGFAMAVENDHLHEGRIDDLLAELLANAALENLGL